MSLHGNARAVVKDTMGKGALSASENPYDRAWSVLTDAKAAVTVKSYDLFGSNHRWPAVLLWLLRLFGKLHYTAEIEIGNPSKLRWMALCLIWRFDRQLQGIRSN